MDFEQPQRELNNLMLSKTWQNIVIFPAILPANLNWIISDFFESSTHTFVASVTRCAPLFNFVVEYVADESSFTRIGLTEVRDMSLPKAPNVFAAVEKLGLHLEKSKASREFIVIEHVEKPSEN
jgi:uncharacterized protein (TIGR03435 family)